MTSQQRVRAQTRTHDEHEGLDDAHLLSSKLTNSPGMPAANANADVQYAACPIERRPPARPPARPA